MTTKTSNGKAIMNAINRADWFSKRSYKYKYNDDCNDIEKCACTNRIGIILQFYSRSISLHDIDEINDEKANEKKASISMYNLLYELVPNYSSVKLLNDYHHIIANHTHSSLQFELFYEYILNKYIIASLCNIKSCKSFHRNYRNRYFYANRSILYNHSDDAQEIFIIKLLDRIHSFVLHSIECGYKLTQKQVAQIGENIKLNDANNNEIKSGEIKSILNVLKTHKNDMKMCENIVLNIDRFSTNIRDENDEKIGRKYSFGHGYKYYKSYSSTNEWYIDINAKYRNLKAELLNEMNKININEFNEEIKNAIDIIHSKYGKQIKCKYPLCESKELKENQMEIGINEGNVISIDHMLSLLFYSNYKHLQILFKNTFLKINQTENNLHLIGRHAQFAHFGKLLYETIHLFGEDIANTKNRNKHQTFYHFINGEIIFQHSFTYFYCPISTSNNLETVILYSLYNNNKILLNLDRPHDGMQYYNYFDCGLISDFTNQYELIFYGSLLKIKSILNIQLSINYEFYLHVFDILFSKIVNGNVLYQALEINDVPIVITNTLKNMLTGNDTDDDMDEYILQLFNDYALRTQHIHINLWLFDLESVSDEKEQENIDRLYGYKIFQPFFVSNDNEWIYLNNLCKIFKNCNILHIYNGDWIKKELLQSIQINAVFIDKLIQCLSNKNNLRTVYIYLPNYNRKDLKDIINDFKYRFSAIKWQISIQKLTVMDYSDTFSVVDTLHIDNNSFL